MKSKSLRCLLLSAAMLSSLVAAAGPAHASLTPGGATISLHSFDAELTIGATNVRCANSYLTGTIAANGRSISASIAYDTCYAGAPATDATLACRGMVTLRETASTTGISATGNVSLDSGFECTLRLESFACTTTIRGPQGPMARWLYAVDALVRDWALSLALGAVNATTSGFPCPASRSTTLEGRYWVESVNGSRTGRITIS